MHDIKTTKYENICVQRGMDNKHHKTRVPHTCRSRLPSEPPHDDKKPKDEDEEDDVPQPSTPLTLGHIVHAPKRATEDARRFRKRVVLLTQIRKKNKEFCQSDKSHLV